MNISIKNCVDKFVLNQEKHLKKIQEIVADKNVFQCVEFDSETPLKTEKFNIRNVIYYFELVSGPAPNEICEKLSAIKAEIKELKLPKVNAQNVKINGADNKILYIGKSLGKFATRLNQHQGYESKKTYALHLSRWKSFFKSEVKLKLYFISYDTETMKVNPDLLELIESSLHFNLYPILGRTGH